MHKNKNFFIALFLLIFLGGTFLFVPQTGIAQGFNYQLMEKIPGMENVGGNDLPKYVEAIYKTALIIVVLSAVLMVSIGGFMYLTSAGNTAALTTAKKVIFDAVIGLVIALVAWLILNVINPDLVNVKIKSLSIIQTSGVPPTGKLPPHGSGVFCGGYTVTSDISINQCSNASQTLSDILNCMNNKYSSPKISSISDSAGFDTCKAKTCTCPNGGGSCACPPCAHGQTSCHYGGGSSQTSAKCQESQAADFSIKNESGIVDLMIANQIKLAASACGGRVNDESDSPTSPHIHVSAPTNCCNL